MNALLAFDNHLFFLLNGGLGRPWLDPVFLFATWLGSWSVALVAIAMLWGEGRARLWRRHVPIMIAGALLTGLANRAIKKSIHAPRPAKYYRAALEAGTVHIRFLEKKIPTRKSFPSGHSATAFFFMTYVAFRRRRLAAWAFALAALIALSRVCVGAHFPLDCLGGALVGGLGAWLSVHVYDRLKPLPEPGSR